LRQRIVLGENAGFERDHRAVLGGVMVVVIV